MYWLSGFTYPTGFLTAVLQTTARRNAIPIDTLAFDFSVINLDEKEIIQPPKEGVYVKGMFLEGENDTAAFLDELFAPCMSGMCILAR